MPVIIIVEIKRKKKKKISKAIGTRREKELQLKQTPNIKNIRNEMQLQYDLIEAK